MLTEKEKQEVKKRLEWNVGKGKRFDTLIDLIRHLREMYTHPMLKHGGYFGVNFERLIPYLEDLNGGGTGE